MHVDHAATRPTPRTNEREHHRQPWWMRQEEEAGLGRYRQACREAEAARLLMAEIGRRHGPMD